MRMDVTSPNGAQYLRATREAAEILHKSSGYRLAAFPEHVASTADGFMESPEGEIVALYEIKARRFSYDTFRSKFNSQWLLSYDKIHNGLILARLLKMPFVGIIYCIDDKVVLSKTLWTADGKLEAAMKLEQTDTSQGVNGGVASRPNAYIDMSGAKVNRATLDVEATLW